MPVAARGADARFLLPVAPRSIAAELTDGPTVDAFASVGVVAVGDADAELAVVRADASRRAARLRIPQIVIIGRAPVRELRRAGYHVERHLVRWGARGLRLAVPRRSRAAVTLALG